MRARAIRALRHFGTVFLTLSFYRYRGKINLVEMGNEYCMTVTWSTRCHVMLFKCPRKFNYGCKNKYQLPFISLGLHICLFLFFMLGNFTVKRSLEKTENC